MTFQIRPRGSGPGRCVRHEPTRPATLSGSPRCGALGPAVPHLLLALLLLALLPQATSARQGAPASPGENPVSGVQSTGLRAEDLHRLLTVGRVVLSPQGGWVAYSVSDRSGAGRPESRLRVRDLGSGEETEVGSGVSDLAWSPSGERLAFLGSRDGASGLFLVTVADGTIQFVTSTAWTNRPLPSTGSRLSWAPEGDRLVFVSAVAPPEDEAASTDPVVITRYLYKPTAATGDTRRADHRRLHLHVADLSDGSVRQLTDGGFDEHSVDWSPDGREILFVSNREPDPDRFFNYDIFAIRTDDGAIRRLTATESAEYSPTWSPDGARIAYQGTQRGLTSSETTLEDTHVWLMDADGGRRRDLGREVDGRQGPPAWSSDGRRGYFTVAGGPPEPVVDEPGSMGSWSLAAEDVLAYALTGPDGPAELRLRSDGSPGRRLTDLNGALLAEREIAPVTSFTFRGVDGLEVEAFLTHPLGSSEGSRHPLVVMIKGGPHSQRGMAFNDKAQVYAARGWAVLMVNYRGSIGYGQAFADAIFRDQNGMEALDVLYGTQAAIRRNPWIDRDRVGVEGGSYGGQLTNWLVTQTDLFAAAIPIAGISNLVSFNYMAYYHDYLAVEYGAWPHQGEVMDMLWARSPLRFVAQVRTPVMLVHGENDNDVPIAEAEQFYIALKDVGVEAVMLRYPREGHGIRETAHEVDLVRRSIAWYERHFAEAPGRR